MNEEAMDMDMTEVEASNAASPPPPPPPPPAPQEDVVGSFLALARQLVDQGKPSQALQAAGSFSIALGCWKLFSEHSQYLSFRHDWIVVMAMRAKGGDQAVFYILQRARELYISKLQASAEADQLASLFAECAIAEAQPARSEPTPSPLPSPSLSIPVARTTPPSHPIDSQAYQKSILAETGRKQIMLDAFSDGSSFICLQCGGLVSNHRKDEHYAYWCQF